MWLLFGVLTALAWGTADLFYKRGSDERDNLSQLKVVVMVGAVMGLHALLYLGHMAANGESFNASDILVYLPVSAMYILSMTLGYVGLRFIELSISSPIQNSSGAVVALLCFIVLGRRISGLQLAAILMICAGVLALSVLEGRGERGKTLPDSGVTAKKKKLGGAAAIIFPILYCVIDAIGTFLDDIWLDESSPKLGEDSALVAYELTFFVCGVLALLYITVVKKERFRIRAQGSRALAAVFETVGQFFYVLIIGGNGIVVAPLVSAYCVVSMLLSRIFLKEKLSRAQYGVAAAVVVGIALLAVAEEL